MNPHRKPASITLQTGDAAIVFRSNGDVETTLPALGDTGKTPPHLLLAFALMLRMRDDPDWIDGLIHWAGEMYTSSAAAEPLPGLPAGGRSRRAKS
jgi:hypothetical protein